MIETMRMIQRLAYVKGQEVGIEHAKRQCLVSGYQLMQLAFDFAALFLFQDMHSGVILDAHSRAFIRAQAFSSGYLASNQMEDKCVAMPSSSHCRQRKRKRTRRDGYACK